MIFEENNLNSILKISAFFVLLTVKIINYNKFYSKLFLSYILDKNRMSIFFNI